MSTAKQRISISYKNAHDLLQEGDVLMFRYTTWWSRFVKASTMSKYVHVGLASRPNGLWEVIEFHGKTGGTTKHLAQIVRKHSGYIDVYRPSTHQDRIIYNPVHNTTLVNIVPFDGKTVTDVMRKLTGLPYGWKRIWWMFKHRLFLWNLFFDYSDLIDDDTPTQEVVYPVCSTAISYAFSKACFDLLKNRSDEWVQPGDLALSPNLNELFTLTWVPETDEQFL